MSNKDTQPNQPPLLDEMWEQLHNRGVVAQTAGELKEAADHFQTAAWVLFKSKDPQQKICRAKSLVCLAHVFMMLSQPDAALCVLKTARKTREGLLPEDYVFDAETLHLMAMGFTEIGQYKEAHHHFQKTYAVVSKLVPQDHEYLKLISVQWKKSNADWAKARSAN